MKTLIVEIKDESKTEFVETLLSEIEGITVTEKNKVGLPKKVALKKQAAKRKIASRLFEKTAGMWEGRDIDARELRRKAWGIDK